MQSMDSRIKLIIWMSCALFLCGCKGNQDIPEDNPATEENPVLTDKYEFLESGASAALSQEQVSCVGKLNEFSFTLAGKVEKAKGTKSFAFSPLSVSYVLGMLANGAAGATREEILGLLGPDIKDIQAANALFRDLLVLSKKGTAETEVLEAANIVLADKSFPIKDSYVASAKQYYDSPVISMDFTSREKVVKYVNGIVSENTHGVIKDAISQEELGAAICILFNTLYFKADWALQFPEELTQTRDFTGASGTKRQEKLMESYFYGGVGYMEGNGYTTLTLPFGNSGQAGNYLCSFILPDEGKTVSDVLGKLGSDKWKPSVAFPAGVSAVNVRLPKFKIDLSDRFNEILKEAGMVTAFGGNADFSNLSSAATMISLFKHVCSVTMDEAGIEASAASLAVLEETSTGEPPVEVKYKYFYADRPFLFVISEKTTGTFLFVGSYR